MARKGVFGGNPFKSAARTGFKISRDLNTIGHITSGKPSKIAGHFIRKAWAKKSGKTSKKVIPW